MFSKAKKKTNEKQDFGDELVEIGDMIEKTRPAKASSGKAQRTTGKMTGNNKRQPVRHSGVPSLISADVIIKGTIEAEGEVQFDGMLVGDIRAKGLVIGEGATVKGEVIAEKVKISGTVDGAIRAGQVELASSANVKGDILHKALSIETGARFDGNCRHSDNPTTDKTSFKKPARPAPAKVSAPAEQPAQAPEAAMAEVPVSPAPVEQRVEAVLEEKMAKPVMKSVPASSAGSSFLSRGGKADLR